MSSVKVWALVVVTTLVGTSARAADMPYQIPMPMPVPMQPVCVPRAQAPMYPGDIGMSNQQVGKLDNFLYAGNTIEPIGMGFDSAPIFGLGIGYQYNEWLRFDVTAEYRGRANFHGLDIVNRTYTDEYHASKSEWLFLANIYADLGTWWCVTPFVGLGLGFSRNTISSFLDVNTPNNGVAFAAAESQWSFAWAIHAGLAVKATPNMTVELSYRYVNLGDATSGDIITYQGTNNFFNPMLFKNISSHDFRLGLRFMCCDVAPPAPPPPQMVYQPQPQLYVPAPVYAPPPPPPPLMRKG
jgi:opacity protein-like surface antigen